MKFTVYALRLTGDTEIRYIGQTNGDPLTRVANLRSCEIGTFNASLFGEWLETHRNEIETRVVATFGTREEAKAGERAAISVALLMGQRLFNRDHVPKHLRISDERIPHELIGASEVLATVAPASTSLPITQASTSYPGSSPP